MMSHSSHSNHIQPMVGDWLVGSGAYTPTNHIPTGLEAMPTTNQPLTTPNGWLVVVSPQTPLPGAGIPAPLTHRWLVASPTMRYPLTRAHGVASLTGK